jgi:hypothetical protein
MPGFVETLVVIACMWHDMQCTPVGSPERVEKEREFNEKVARISSSAGLTERLDIAQHEAVVDRYLTLQAQHQELLDKQPQSQQGDAATQWIAWDLLVGGRSASVLAQNLQTMPSINVKVRHQFYCHRGDYKAPFIIRTVRGGPTGECIFANL